MLHITDLQGSILRIFTLLILFYSFIWANQTFTINLINENNNTLVIQNKSFKVGQSAYIKRVFDNSLQTIFAKGYIISTTPKEAIIKYDYQSYTTQDALPTGKWKVDSKKDLVVLDLNYNRDLIIADTHKHYKDIVSKYPQTDHTHPDHFAAYLSSVGHSSPLIEDFMQFCYDYAIGIVHLQFDTHLVTLDCSTMKILNKEDFKRKDNFAKAPFYHRIGEINSNFFGAGSDKVENHPKYYLELLKEKNMIDFNLSESDIKTITSEN